MTRKQFHYAFLVMGALLILSLMIIGQGSEASGRFALLFLPLILLGGYWEEQGGALTTVLMTLFAMVLAYVFNWIPPALAIPQVVLAGLLFGFALLVIYEQDQQQKRYTGQKEPLEKELLKFDRKAFLIRQQIESYESRLKNLIRTYEMAKKLSGMMNLEIMLDEARTEVALSMPHHFQNTADTDVRLAFYIPEEDGNGFERISSKIQEVPDQGFPDRLPGGDLASWLGEGLSPLRLKDLAADPRLAKLAAITPFRSMMIIPLMIYDIAIGIMAMGSNQAGVFSPTDFSQAELMGKQILFALRKALLYRKVQTLSFTDSQTGLYVHRFFQERLREELHRAERYHQPLSLIMLDMDNFKMVNDQQGHQVGDAVLVEAAERIVEMSGHTALVARYGGEEFAVLLPNTHKAKAMQVAESINRFMKETPVDVGTLKLAVTISGGVSSYPDDALSREALIATADEALYQAKNAGRDRIGEYRGQEKNRKIND